MNTTEDRDPVEVLASEFLERQRRGEEPTIDEYLENFPHLADEINDLFPTIAAMENWKQEQKEVETSTQTWEAPQLERLGEYRILSEIGRGGMGIVYEAEQESLSRRVALKVLPRQAMLEEKHVLRFKREARLAAKLHHTNIVPVFGVGEAEGLYFYVMQRINGVGLDRIIAELRCVVNKEGEKPPTEDLPARSAAHALCSGEFVHSKRFDDVDNTSVGTDTPLPQPISDTQLNIDQTETYQQVSSEDDTQQQLHGPYWKSIARIGIQIADALSYAHRQGMMHRDVKPANLLVDDRGVSWLTDFGLARDWSSEKLSRTGDVAGTLLYLSPEQLEGKPEKRSDIYSLGVTLYEMLTLRPAFRDMHQGPLMQQILRGNFPRPRSINSKVPKDLETIILKAMAIDVDQRYATASELRDDLERFLEDRPVHARRTSAIVYCWRWCKRNRAIAALGSLTLILLVLVAVLATVGYLRQKQANELVQKSLKSEKQQRERAEASSLLAQRALDRIFDRFTLDRLGSGIELTLEDDQGEEVEVSVPPVLTKEDAALLQDLLGYYEKLAQQPGSSSKLKRKVAKAQRRVGDIRRSLGQIQEAEKAYERALTLYQQLRNKNPKNVNLTLELARVYNRLGFVQSDNRGRNEPRGNFQALALLEPIKDTANRPDILLELARTHYLLAKRIPGNFHRGGPPSRRPRFPSTPFGRGFGRPGEYVDHREEAIKILDELVKQYPQVPDYQFLLALCHREVPRTRWKREPDSMLKGVDQSAKILEELVERYPAIPDYRHELINTWSIMDPRALIMTGKLSTEIQNRLEQALELAKILVMEHPNVPDYASSRVHVLSKLAMVNHIQKNYAEATSFYQQAIQQQEQLIQRFPKAESYQFWGFRLQESFARLLVDQGQWDQAKALLESMIAKQKKIKVPANRFFSGLHHHKLHESYRQLSRVYEKLGDEVKAKEMKKEAEKYRRDRRGGRGGGGRNGDRGGGRDRR